MNFFIKCGFVIDRIELRFYELVFNVAHRVGTTTSLESSVAFGKVLEFIPITAPIDWTFALVMLCGNRTEAGNERYIPIALTATVFLSFVRGVIDKASLPKELGDVVFIKGRCGLGVVVRDIIGFVGASHDCECL